METGDTIGLFLTIDKQIERFSLRFLMTYAVSTTLGTRLRFVKESKNHDAQDEQIGYLILVKMQERVAFDRLARDVIQAFFPHPSGGDEGFFPDRQRKREED